MVRLVSSLSGRKPNSSEMARSAGGGPRISLAVRADPPISTPRSPMGTSKPQGCLVQFSVWGSLELHIHHDASAVARSLAPDEPVILNRPHAAARAARFFVEKFPGTTMYAVKANPSPELLQILWDSGITHFDVASIAEVRLVRALLPEATLCFMHPVKTGSAIAEAYK